MLAPLWAPFRTPAPRRRGGFRQQREAEDEELASSPPPPGKCKLLIRQFLKWCQGDISATALHEVATDAQDDGFQHPMIDRVAALRGGQHAHDELMSLIKRETDALDLMMGIGSPGSAVTEILKPSNVIASFLKHHPDKFAKKIGASPAKVKKFWQGFKKQPQNHDVMKNHTYLKDLPLKDLYLTVPLALHEDAGPVSKSKSAACLSWSAITAEGFMCTQHVLTDVGAFCLGVGCVLFLLVGKGGEGGMGWDVPFLKCILKAQRRPHTSRSALG